MTTETASKPMRRLNKPDFYAGIVIAAVGLGYYLETLRIARTGDVVGPETLPTIVGLGLTVMGVLLAISAFRKHKLNPEEIMEKVTAEDSEGTTSAAETDSSASQAAPVPVSARVLINFALFFVYLFIFIPVGFLISTAVFLFAVTITYSKKHWLRNLIYSVCFSAGIYFAFKYGLGVYLPPGILG